MLTACTHISIVRSLMKSQWSGFSTSTTPQGYSRPRTFRPRTSNNVFAPQTANGTASFSCLTWKYITVHFHSSKFVAVTIYTEINIQQIVESVSYFQIV